MKVLKYACSMLSLLLISNLALTEVDGETPEDSRLKNADIRLRAIYEHREFRAKTFRAEWLPDSSGYTTMESVPGTEDRVRIRFDAENGDRSVAEPSGNENFDRFGNLSPDSQHVIHFVRGDLHVRTLRSGETTHFTHFEPDASLSISQTVWSPDGKRIAYVQSDDSRVRKRLVLIHNDPSYPTLREDHFARVGERIPSLRIGVVDIEGGGTFWIPIDQPEEGFYLGQVDWAGNSDELLVEIRSRFRDHRKFILANVQKGEMTCIFEESDPAWVVASIAKNAGLEWVQDGRAFIVLSEKDGWRHAYVYSREGEEQALLTPGESDVIERVKIDEARGWFYYYASPDNATQKYLYRTKLDGTGTPERVTPANQPGTHDYDFSPDARWAFHTYSTFDAPPITELIELPEHRVVRVLENNDELRQKMESLKFPPTEFFQLDIGDGVVMDAWMIKPSDFNPAQKYPVFVYVYSEPHAQTVLDTWGRVHADYHRMIADMGYLVVSIDSRGTPAPKGAAWRRAVFGSLGPLSTEEQAAGLQELGRTRSYVDLSRVGIWGWSGGGSNTLNAMFRRPDVYHMGIAVAPKPQPHLYNAWFQEIYMETRETNPDGYRRAAALNYAEGLDGDLLIIHGTGETNTHLEITEGLVDRLIELGKPFDYMAYPGRNHGLHEGQGTDVHLRLLMTRYLLDHLPPGPR
jgi:dipeptidyl-peptidase 4